MFCLLKTVYVQYICRFNYFRRTAFVITNFSGSCSTNRFRGAYVRYGKQTMAICIVHIFKLLQTVQLKARLNGNTKNLMPSVVEVKTLY